MVGSIKNGDPAEIEELSDFIRLGYEGPLALLGLGTSRIWERMEISYRLRATSTPTLIPQPKPRTQSVETKPTLDTFVGTWVGSSLSVSLSLVGARRLRAHVVDRTQAVPFELDVTTSLGATGAIRPLQELSAQVAVMATSTEELLSSTALAALSASLYAQEERPIGTPDWMAAPVARSKAAMMTGPITQLVLKSQAEDIGIKSFSGLAAVTAVVAERVRETDYMLHLGSGVAL